MLKPVPVVFGLPPMACGPTAICAATGLDPRTVLIAAHKYMGRRTDRPIVGMSDAQICGTLALLGFRCVIEQWHNNRGGFPTLAAFIEEMPKLRRPALIRFTEHCAAFTYDEYLCTYTEGKPVPIALAPFPRSRVQSIIKVYPL